MESMPRFSRFHDNTPIKPAETLIYRCSNALCQLLKPLDQLTGYLTWPTVADHTSINIYDGNNLRSGTSQKTLIGGIDFIAIENLLRRL